MRGKIPDNTDPGQPSESAIAAFRALQLFGEGCSDRPTEAANVTTEGAAVPVTAAPVEARQHAREAFRLLQLLNSPPCGEFAIFSKSIDLDVSYLMRIDQTVGEGENELQLLRFVIPNATSLRIRPSDELVLGVGTQRFSVSYLGDMHDLDGVLPFKIITFIKRPRQALEA